MNYILILCFVSGLQAEDEHPKPAGAALLPTLHEGAGGAVLGADGGPEVRPVQLSVQTEAQAAAPHRLQARQDQ